MRQPRQQLWVAIRAMFHEEWRLHSELFGGWRFAGFPASLFGLAALAALSLAFVGVPLDLLAAGVVALAFLLGLQTGTIGFEGRDALDDLVGGATLLIFSTRTLPLSNVVIVTAFIVKDVAYYAVLFILPMALGVLTGHSAAVALAPDLAVQVATSFNPLFALNAWLASILAFLLGLTLTLVVTGVIVKGVRAAAVGTLLIGLLGVLAYDGRLPRIDALGVATPPYDGVTLALVAMTTVVIAAIGMWRFDADARSQPAVKSRNTYAVLTSRFDASRRTALVAKTLVDVHRSSGGVWKLLVSSTVLVATAYIALDIVQHWFALHIAPGIAFGALLSATAFSTYNWLTQADDPSDYQHYPVAVDDLLRAKGIAFAVLELPVVVVYYIAVGLVFAPGLADLAVGGVVLLGLTAYLFGATVYFTGFRPNEFLFDTVVFMQYCLVAILGLLPVLLVGFFLADFLSLTVALGIVGYGLLMALIGIVLFTRAVEKWAFELTA